MPTALTWFASLRCAIALTAAFVALACTSSFAAAQVTGSAPLPEPSPEASSAFRLGPGDVLSVTVWKQPALSMQLPVTPDGTLRYPLAGHLEVKGRTLAEVEAALTEKLREQLREAVVTVSLVQAHSYRIYVVGEVLRPGEFVLRAPVSVVQAIAMANSFTPFAKRDRLLIIRRKGGSETRQVFDYNAYVRGDVGQDIILEPDDTVIVQ